MEIRHLRYFTAVAEELHFGRAASRLCMSQPPLSKRIAELEHELGVPLFVRTSRSVELTAHGQRLLPLAVEALRAFDAIGAAMAMPANLDRPLRVGFPNDTSHDVLRMLRVKLAELHLSLDWTEASSSTQQQMLLTGGLDLGVLRTPIQEPGLWASPRLRQTLGIAMSHDHPLAGNSAIALSALQGQTLLMFSRRKSPLMYDNILATCAAHGFRPKRIRQGEWSFHSLTVESELASGNAVLLIPATVVDRLGNVAWRPIEGEPLGWETAVFCRRGEEKDTAIRAAVGAVLESLQKNDGWLPQKVTAVHG
ncbi:LysR family transcriptional regulator [Nocardia sp. CA-119907]|uniref:LysR family transcriptional regulator n=1 Tax=Nocardia sp. CA-119907 TaxID=3239973 RepID=UPI003D96C6E8